MEIATSKTDRKVLHLIGGADRGGAATHVLSLLDALRRSGEVGLVCLGDGPLARRASESGLLRAVLRGGPAAQKTALWAVLREERPALLHCHGTRANVLGALLKGLFPGPVIATVHSDHTLDYLGRPAAQALLRPMNAAALRRMDALVCVSDAMAALYRLRGFPDVYALYNGLDFDRPLCAPTFAPDGRIVVGTAARLDPVKDLSTLLRGFAPAAEREPRLLLRIAGAGPEAGRLHALAAELGVAGRVVFHGWIEDVEGFTASLHIAALTSLSETFPYALLTAARYGLPVVSTDVGGVSALVEDGVGGFLFRPGDAAALAAALSRLSADAQLRRGMGRALRRRAESRFSLAAMAERQREIYRQLLQNDRKRDKR